MFMKHLYCTDLWDFYVIFIIIIILQLKVSQASKSLRTPALCNNYIVIVITVLLVQRSLHKYPNDS